jgi:flagellar hook-associated protein 3 FlgL
MLTETTIRHLQTSQARLEDYSNQLTSGRRLHKPSDDPIAVVAAMSHRTTLEQVDQHLKNIDEALAWVEVTDSALDGAGQGLGRAYELAVNAASDTLSPSDRLAIKAEIDSLTEHTLQVANARFGDQYIFSGARTTTPAYTGGLPPTYGGDTTLIQREIGPQTDITVNTVGQGTFDSIFAALQSLSTALAANDTTGIQSGLAAIQGAQTTLLATRAQVGARANRLEAQQTRLQDVQVNVTELRSKVEDTDYTRVMLNFSTAETVYKAALQAGARTLQPSLLDYLR